MGPTVSTLLLSSWWEIKQAGGLRVVQIGETMEYSYKKQHTEIQAGGQALVAHLSVGNSSLLKCWVWLRIQTPYLCRMDVSKIAPRLK